jgi:putative PIN family toxin of toxin-antitoxin system
MVRLVLDANVFVSGIFWSGPPSKILKAWQKGEVSLVMSAEILQEYTRVGEILAKKYKSLHVDAFIKLATIHAEVYRPAPLVEPVSCDPDDDKFIACALSAGCKTIVSGDSDLLEVSGYADILVYKPADFVVRFLS